MNMEQLTGITETQCEIKDSLMEEKKQCNTVH